MGQAMKFPIGIQDFESIINGGYVYVDKTDLIYRLVTEGKIYFLSRPRRFGKSLDQIDEKGYMIPYTADGRKLVKCGINFSTEPRTIEEWEIKEEE